MFKKRILWIGLLLGLGLGGWWGWHRVREAAGPRPVWVYHGEGVVREPPWFGGELVLSAASDAPLIALDRSNGQVRWRFSGEGAGIWERSLAVDGDTVWVGVRGGGLAALRLTDGTLRWQQPLDGEVLVHPLVTADTVYVAVSAARPDGTLLPEEQARLVALNRADGRVRWVQRLDAYALQTPFVQGDRLWVGGSAHDPQAQVDEGGVTALFALDATDGRPRWSRRATDGFVKSLAVDGPVLVYLAYQDVIRALDADSGEPLWQRDTGNWTPAFTLADGVAYYGSANTKVHALDVHTGTERWQFDIPGGSFNYVLGWPAVAGGRVYFLTQRGDLMALRAADGRLLWHRSTDILAAVGVRVAPPWLVLGDMQGDIHLYRLP